VDVVAVGAMAATLFLLHRDYRRLESYKYHCGLGAIGLLVLPALPVIGQTVNGARLWIHFGGLQFQPGELAKVMLIVFLAGYLREKREVLAQGRLKDFGPLLVIWGGAMLVLVETNDLGSALLYFGIFLAMLYVATGRIAYVLIGGALFVGGAAAAYKLIGHVRTRVEIWIDPWPHIHTTGYQITQSLYSISNGGFGGAGLGKGTFTTTSGTTLIPSANTDFIYSAIAQELGLVGAAALLLVFMLFIARGFRVAMLADDGFSKLLAAGLTFSFALQTFIIVGGILRMIPLTGVTLPFVSYGGSSVVANFVLLAGLLLISTAPTPPRDEQADRPARTSRPRAHRRADRRHDLTGRPGPRPGLRTDRTTRSSSSRSSPIKRGLIRAADGEILATNRKKRNEVGADRLPPPLSEGRALCKRRRLLDGLGLAQGSRPPRTTT
jgi:cell division protein FtsW (lipid II flippase)